MGYVRMIRSGGLNTCSSSIRFVPDLENIISFEEYTRKADLPAETLNASKYVIYPSLIMKKKTSYKFCLDI